MAETGNAAAMRGALLRVKEARGRDLEYVTLADIDAEVDAALAAPARNVDTVKSLNDFLSEKYQDDMTLDMIKEWREDEVAFGVRHPGEASLLHSLRWLFLSAKEGGAE